MPLDPDIVARIGHRLASHAGLEPPAWIVEARANARIAALGVPPEVYVDLIESGRGAGELEELVEQVRVGESRLFRHATQIAALVDHVVPIWRAKGRRSVRVWSAGCAAGEEPYTLAAVLARAMPGASINIVASDVSGDALDVARTGSYPRDALDDVPETWRDAFEIDDDGVRVRPDLAAMVRFERANLVDGPVGRGFDLVWCRNVLIYFTPIARKRAVDTLVHATAVGGFVFVGYSESLRDVAELDAVRAGDAVYYMRRESPRVSAPRLTPVHGIPIHPADPGRRTPPPQLIRDASRPRPPTSPGFAVPPLPGQAATPAYPRPHRPPTSPGFAVPDVGRDVSAVPQSIAKETTAVGWPAVTARTTNTHRVVDRPDGATPFARTDAGPSTQRNLSPPPAGASGSGPTRPRPPTDPGILRLRGTPDVEDFTAQLTTRLAAATVDALTIDLDGAELLGDELAPVLRRASAAARSAGVELVVRATRTGPKRWLARHGLDSLGDDA